MILPMSSEPSEPPFLDPSSVDFLADPHPFFDALRPSTPVVADPLGWSVLSYELCDAAFHDVALVPGIDPLLEQRGIGALWGTPGHTLTDSEGADHQRLRRTVSPWFTAKRIAALRARTSELADALLGDVGDSGAFDAMADLADVIPSRLFCWMVGAPDEDAGDLARLSKVLLGVFTATDEMVAPVRAAKAELGEYTRELLDRKRRDPQDDLATFLAEAAVAGSISELDAFYLLEELLSASVDNTANTAGLALWTLATHPSAWSAVHDDPDLLGGAIDECGRFQPAIRHTIKFAVADTELGGVALPEGSLLTIRVAAAHRDPQVFVEPHRFDVTRRQARSQLAFGAGRHYCLGAALGKMEVQEIVGAAVARWPTAHPGDAVEMHLNASGQVVRLPLVVGSGVGAA
jgi:cytochrome P450